MRSLIIILLVTISLNVLAQKLPHGTVFGRKPDMVGLIQADKLEAKMAKRTRMSATVGGRITLVTKSKGGWFDVDAGNGNIITAHFKKANIVLPPALKNRYIIMEGVAQKRLTPVPGAHYAGQTKGTPQPGNKHMLFFEVSGLMVDK